jgi:hypothetical protein
MSYTVDQKIGKYIYVYEGESYWDPQKKQPRQKRRYLGKRDAQSGAILIRASLQEQHEITDRSICLRS